MTAVGGPPIAVVGAGSWGTALAIQFARSGRETRLWGRDGAHRAALVIVQSKRKDLERLATFVDQGVLTPIIDRTLPLDRPFPRRHAGFPDP